jgi:hypothetical protein
VITEVLLVDSVLLQLRRLEDIQVGGNTRLSSV